MLIKLMNYESAQNLKKWAKETKAEKVSEEPLTYELSNPIFDKHAKAALKSKNPVLKKILGMQTKKMVGLIEKSLSNYVPKCDYEVLSNE